MPEAHDLAAALAAARAGSSAALGQALETYRHYLLAIAGEELEADLAVKGGASDLVQETFLEAQRDFGQFHGTSDGAWRAWLKQILRHNVANFSRAYRQTARRAVDREVLLEGGDGRRGLALDLPAQEPSPSSAYGRADELNRLEQAVARLPEPLRQIVLLRNRDRCSFEEIAARLGCSAEQARRQWLAAVQHLKREMEEPT